MTSHTITSDLSLTGTPRGQQRTASNWARARRLLLQTAAVVVGVVATAAAAGAVYEAIASTGDTAYPMVGRMVDVGGYRLHLDCRGDGTPTVVLDSGLGKSSLDWYGVRHYVSQQPVLQLYGWTAAKLPDWFTERFPAEYHRKRLFDESPSAPLHAGPFEKLSGAPRVSAPERGLLEVLSEVGVRQPLQEARELAESAYSLRADVLRELLQCCTSVKTVRLCLQLGRELFLPWAAKLDPTKLPTGSARAWVSRSADGLLVLKP